MSELQVVIFAFSLILGDSLMVSPFLKYGEGDFFPKNAFHGGTHFWVANLRRIVLHGGLMIRLCQGGGFSQNANLNTVNLKIFINLGGIFS